MKNNLLDVFNKTTFGFDEFYDNIKASKPSTYPPYNMKKCSNGNYILELGVSGFAQDELEVVLDNNKLIVSGEQITNDDDIDVEWLWRGLASRNFKQNWVLSDSLVIKSAKLELGILTIELEKIIPDKNKIEIIEIK
jgi:molecular chaperone IbpA